MNNGVNILDVAKILICKFNNEDKPITQLKLQKLLYFIEAYYMVTYDTEKLYNEEFFAWTYGPVCKEVYNKYKFYLDHPIYENSCDELPNLNKNIINCINEVIDIFGDLRPKQLVTITHMVGSPWYNTQTNSSQTISKKETKKWFKEKFLTNGN